MRVSGRVWEYEEEQNLSDCDRPRTTLSPRIWENGKEKKVMAEDNTNVQAHTPNPVLRRLSALVGEWETEASVGGQPLGRGRAVFAWLETGAFLVQHSQKEYIHCCMEKKQHPSRNLSWKR